MIKVALLFSLVVLAFGSGYQGDLDDVLDDLMTRIRHRIRDRQYYGEGPWDSYIKELFDEGGANVDRARIIRLDGGALLTSGSRPNALALTVDEAQAIAEAFNSGDFSAFQNNGVMAEGTKYYFLAQHEQKAVYAYKGGNGALSLGKSKTAVVVAHAPSRWQLDDANEAVHKIVEKMELADL